MNTMIQLFTSKLLSTFQPILLSTGLLWVTSSIAATKPPLVKTTAVVPWQEGVQGQLSCQVSVPQQYTVASESQAKLTYMVSSGSFVKKGDLLAEQDGFYLHQSLKAQQYELTQQSANLDYHQQEYQRLIQLGKTHVSASAINEHALSLKLAQQAVAVANNTIATLNKQISALKHYAPDDGVVTALHSNLGSFVARGEAILSFIVTNNKELHCELPLTQDQLTSQLEHKDFFLSQSVPLTLSRYSRSLNQRHQTQSLWFRTPKETPNLPIGKLVTVQWQSQLNQLTKIPVQAVTFERNSAHSWRINKHQEAEKVAIEVVQNQAHHFIVQSDLQAGEQVIVLGQSTISDGAKVKVMAADTLFAQGN
ncbi:efflux RND transporter periplasmic adaptor subunit [Pseudoalteromonas luteoviolacea]|nr:efflux RND transporter periplasmic adaptor subunit [Pseudoalteromonas luteoviolacea]